MKILLVMISLFTINAYATDEMFAKQKNNIEQNLEKRISILQEEKSCISSSTSKEDFKKCREKSSISHKALETENKAKRAEHIDEQIKKLQGEKEKINSEVKK